MKNLSIQVPNGAGAAMCRPRAICVTATKTYQIVQIQSIASARVALYNESVALEDFSIFGRFFRCSQNLATAL